jgi:hypothetical protein
MRKENLVLIDTIFRCCCVVINLRQILSHIQFRESIVFLKYLVYL